MRSSPVEHQTLKRVGLAAALAACGGLTYLSTEIGTDLGTTLAAKFAAGMWPFGIFVGSAVLAINVGIVGALAVIAGARGLSLSSASTRTGFLVMWAGADLLAFGLICGNLLEGHDDVIVEWSDAAVLMAYVLVGLGIVLIRTGWKYDVRRATDVIASDTRPPVIYLRSFQDDVQSPVGGLWGVFLKVAGWFIPIGFEQELAAIMNRVGPFVAVGRPGERLPELGASRFYFSDEEWKARVSALIADARLALILCGPTPNLWWEIDHVFASIPARRVLLIIPERGERTRLVERQLEDRLRCPGALQGTTPQRALLAWLFGRDHTIGKAVCFADDWTPTVVPIRLVRSLRMIPMILARPFSLYAAPLEVAFTQLFVRIDIPWRPPGPSQLMAIVLAVTFGWLGGHLFYLGDRRRARRYLLFFWTMVPMFLGLRDAARFALMERRVFGAIYDIPPDPVMGTLEGTTSRTIESVNEPAVRSRL